ncbi:MAG: hypothetical protein OEV80_14490, partial [candidate division Zixibacteria bacterium]|nr:hypothetical protein [candidate division Zixibacteria bacterium]
VGLIVGIVLIVIVVGGGLVCWWKFDDIKKAGVETFVEGIRTQINNNPVEGIDSVRVNTLADGFLAKLETDEVTFEQMGPFVQSLQHIMDDKAVDADEAAVFVQAMIDYYPELADLVPAEDATQEAIEDTTVVIDSLE